MIKIELNLWVSTICLQLWYLPKLCIIHFRFSNLLSTDRINGWLAETCFQTCLLWLDHPVSWHSVAFLYNIPAPQFYYAKGKNIHALGPREPICYEFNKYLRKSHSLFVMIILKRASSLIKIRKDLFCKHETFKLPFH